MNVQENNYDTECMVPRHGNIDSLVQYVFMKCGY